MKEFNFKMPMVMHFKYLAAKSENTYIRIEKGRDTFSSWISVGSSLTLNWSADSRHSEKTHCGHFPGSESKAACEDGFRGWLTTLQTRVTCACRWLSHKEREKYKPALHMNTQRKALRPWTFSSMAAPCPLRFNRGPGSFLKLERDSATTPGP